MLQPAIYTFPGDQYKPHEVQSVALIYSMYYFAYHCGSILARFVTPIIRRAEIKCFGGDDDFYPLVFGVFGCINILILVLLLAGKSRSVCLEPSGSTFVNVLAGMWVNK